MGRTGLGHANGAIAWLALTVLGHCLKAAGSSLDAAPRHAVWNDGVCVLPSCGRCMGSVTPVLRVCRLVLRGGSAATDREPETTARSPPEEQKPLNNAGVGAALSVNSDGEVIFSQMVPGMPAANSGAIRIGDALVSSSCTPCHTAVAWCAQARTCLAQPHTFPLCLPASHTCRLATSWQWTGGRCH